MSQALVQQPKAIMNGRGILVLVAVGAVVYAAIPGGNGASQSSPVGPATPDLARSQVRPADVGRNTAGQNVESEQKVNLVRICTTVDVDHSKANKWTIPAFSVFENAGPLIGDLRDEWSKERYVPEKSDRASALMTEEQVTLTKEQPCADVGAKMLISGPYVRRYFVSNEAVVWDFSHVLGYPIQILAQPNRLEALRGSISLRATALGPIRDWTNMSETAAIEFEPDNPLEKARDDFVKARNMQPPASGNFRICLSVDVNDEQYASVRLPRNLMFASYGRLVGSERDPKPDVDYSEYDGKQSYAVMTLSQLVLTKSKPCGVATVRTVVSSDWKWPFPLVRSSDHLHFQALKMRGVAGDGGDLPGSLGDAMGKGLLNATPVADIGDPLDISGED